MYFMHIFHFHSMNFYIPLFYYNYPHQFLRLHWVRIVQKCMWILLIFPRYPVYFSVLYSIPTCWSSALWKEPQIYHGFTLTSKLSCEMWSQTIRVSNTHTHTHAHTHTQTQNMLLNWQIKSNSLYWHLLQTIQHRNSKYFYSSVKCNSMC